MKKKIIIAISAYALLCAVLVFLCEVFIAPMEGATPYIPYGAGRVTVMDSGTVVAARPRLNFIGATIADDLPNQKVDITITGGGGGTVSTNLTLESLTTYTGITNLSGTANSLQAFGANKQEKSVALAGLSFDGTTLTVIGAAGGSTALAYSGGTNVIVDFSVNTDFNLTLTTNTFFGQPINLTAGRTITIETTENATGTWLVTFHPTYWKFSGGGVLPNTTNAAAVDIISARVNAAAAAVLAVQVQDFR